MAQAYAEAQAELTRARAQRYARELDVIRLSAVVESAHDRSALVLDELAALRREVAELRARPTGPDPLVAALVDQTARLRLALTQQQAQIQELTARLVDALTVTAWPPVLDAEPAATAREADSGSTVVQAERTASVGELARVGGREHDAPPPLRAVAGDPGPYPRADREAQGRHGRTSDAVAEDETVQRLRMIRQAFDG